MPLLPPEQFADVFTPLQHRRIGFIRPLGNVGDGVMMAWRGPAMNRLRLKHLNLDLEDVPSCGQCVEWAWWRPSWTVAQGNAPLTEQSVGAVESAPTP